MMNKREVREKEMQAVIERYRSSGQTQEAFCKENGISKSVLGYWLRKDRPLQGGFVEMDISAPTQGATQITIRCANGTVIEIPI